MAHDDDHAWDATLSEDDDGEPPRFKAATPVIDKEPTPEEEAEWVREWELAARKGWTMNPIRGHEKHKLASYWRWSRQPEAPRKEESAEQPKYDLRKHETYSPEQLQNPEFVAESPYARAYAAIKQARKLPKIADAEASDT